MWFSKVTSLGAVCNTTTRFEDEPCDHQKEGWCPRVVESDREIACSEHWGGNEKKKIYLEKRKFQDCRSLTGRIFTAEKISELRLCVWK
jgi:hypothetical protein